MTTVTPFLWYDDDAEDAINRYRGVFPDTEVLSESRSSDGGLFLAELRLQGQHLVFMNGGPSHPHTPAFSLMVSVEGQEEVDRVSEALIDGGGEQGNCGWLTDAFGLSWQVVPTALARLMGDPDPERAARVAAALQGMHRISIADLGAAHSAR